MRATVLVVDDDAAVVEGIGEALGDQFTVLDAGTADAGLERLAEGDVDLAYADLRLPGPDGLDLLDAVALQQPAALRLLAASRSDARVVTRRPATAHRHLVKPLPAAAIARAIGAALVEPDALAAGAGAAGPVQGVWPELLPIGAGAADALLAATQPPTASRQAAWAAVVDDPGLAALVLRCANAALFATGGPVVSLRAAVTLLGLEFLAELLQAPALARAVAAGAALGPELRALAERSSAVAHLAAHVASTEGCSGRAVDEAFTAGLLHGVGALVAPSRPPAFDDEAVAVGARLLHRWNAPPSLVETLAALPVAPAQADPARPFTATAAVRAARVLMFGAADLLEAARQPTATREPAA